MKRYSMHLAYDNVGLSRDDQGDYVLYSEAQAEVDAVRAKGMAWMDKCTEAQNALGDAQARIEALKWLVEVQEYVLGDLSTKTWEVLLNREYVHPAYREMWATLQAARVAAGE